MPTPRRLLLLCSTALALACGGPAGPNADDQKAKQAAAKQAEDDAKEAAGVAERKAKREAEDKLKAEAEVKIAAELERLSVLPDKLPKGVTCDTVGTAQDAFVRRLGDAKAIAAWDAGGKDKAIPMTIVQCTQADSVKTAVCQQNMFDSAGPELKDETRKIMQVCIDKYGSTKKPPAGMPQKRPG
ncbi:hypothetical protein [Nannocystis sp.]|uniref:hypothetical protein n=1 Tax=Nannocystis sp. TaxID=1962667 RepID=UPI0024251271|nr:hypothetical protein [Nannocystis sp.]MBK7826057.1 hypothetical protein [Nannocystis sp.]MBK9755406.1 hypothetical protein [Nannocystis sp.]